MEGTGHEHHNKKNEVSIVHRVLLLFLSFVGVVKSHEIDGGDVISYCNSVLYKCRF